MKILVTGVAGFIGSQSAKALLAEGEQVTGIDNLNDYYDIALKKARLKDIRAHLNNSSAGTFKFSKVDLCDREAMERIFARGHFEKVCHLAAQAGVRYSFENPSAYIQSNIVGFLNVLDLCVKYKVRHLVYASSSSVYGNSAKIPFSEREVVNSPQSLYAATKIADELMTAVYSKQLGLRATGLRFFTVYGPWERPDMAPYGFMKKIMEGTPIDVFNHGRLSRDFSYIDDVVKGVVSVIQGPCKTKQPVYNIGNGAPIKLTDFIKAIEDVTGKKAVKKMRGMQRGDVYDTFADCTALKRDYSFKPSTPLSIGLSNTYKWFVDYHKIKDGRKIVCTNGDKQKRRSPQL